MGLIVYIYYQGAIYRIISKQSMALTRAPPPGQLNWHRWLAQIQLFPRFNWYFEWYLWGIFCEI